MAPRIVHATAPAPPIVHAVARSSGPAHVSSRAHHPPPASRAPAHRAHPPRVDPLTFSFPLAVFIKDLLRLPRAALHAGDPGHRDGVLLLLSSLAMGVLAVSSFTLLRRLRRLEVGS